MRNSDHRRPPRAAAPRWISDVDVERSVDAARAINALALALVRAHHGDISEMPKTMTTWDPASSAHALGAFDRGISRVAIKTWVNTPAGAQAVMNLFDANTGALLAVVDAGTAGMLRTSGLAALATRALSRSDADEMAILGSGRQSFLQVKAMTEVRPLRRVRVWSPTPDKRQALAQRIEAELGLTATASPTLEEAVDGAPIVTTITRAVEPFLGADLLDPGTHVNAVGAILPRSAELHPDVLRRASVAAVDSLENARRSSRELRERFSDDLDGVVTLGQLLTGDIELPPRLDLTVYKGLGSGVADLTMADLALVARTDDDEKMP
jgi:alanine dehydrogenase